jgi:hypothetical protein
MHKRPPTIQAQPKQINHAIPKEEKETPGKDKVQTTSSQAIQKLTTDGIQSTISPTLAPSTFKVSAQQSKLELSKKKDPAVQLSHRSPEVTDQ